MFAQHPPKKNAKKSWKPCYMTGFQDHRLLTWIMIFSPNIGITQLVINQPGFPLGQLMGIFPAAQHHRRCSVEGQDRCQWSSGQAQGIDLRRFSGSLRSVRCQLHGWEIAYGFLKVKIIEVNGRLSCLITREYQQFHIQGNIVYNLAMYDHVLTMIFFGGILQQFNVTGLFCEQGTIVDPWFVAQKQIVVIFSNIDPGG